MSRGAEVLHRSIRLAERKGFALEEIRAASTLSSTLIRLGRYQEAGTWGAWAVERYERGGYRDEARRLTLINDLAYARLLCGEPLSLQALLASGGQFDDVLPAVSRLYRSTLGDHLVSQQHYAEALNYYRCNYEQSSRSELGAAALDMVRALLGVGEHKTMLELAQRAYFLTHHEHWLVQRAATLAYGIALSVHDPARALPVLEAAVQAYSESLSAHRLAQATMYLASAKLYLNDPEEARLAVAQGRSSLHELAVSGFTLLFGVSEQHNLLWTLSRNLDDGLALRYLGDDSSWFNHQPLRLSRREQEIVALLALHPKGLTLERLGARLGDHISLNNLKTTLSRLRQRLPLTPPPYRLAVSCTADFTQLSRLLAAAFLPPPHEPREYLVHPRPAEAGRSREPALRGRRLRPIAD